MKTLFLVDGAAGTGKSDLLRYLAQKKKPEATFVPKYTTREQRAEEGKRRAPLDLRFPPDTAAEFMTRTDDPTFYWYSYGAPDTSEDLYGFYKSDVVEALVNHDVVLIIVRDCETITRLRNDLTQVRCVSVFVYTDRDLVIQRLRRDGYDEAAIQFRLSRQPIAWADYLKYSDRYDEKLINTSERKDFELLIESLIRRHTERKPDELLVSGHELVVLPPSLIGFRAQLERRLRENPYHCNVFLMMKFRGEKNRRVHEFIQQTLASHGLTCVRSDQPYWDITRNTYNPIAVLTCCRFGIALFDVPDPGNEYSPNVAYELGMMQEQKKECLILRHSALNEVPFDLVKDLYVTYSDNLELQEVIGDWVKKIACTVAES
jgi:guanylate kinase